MKKAVVHTSKYRTVFKEKCIKINLRLKTIPLENYVNVEILSKQKKGIITNGVGKKNQGDLSLCYLLFLKNPIKKILIEKVIVAPSLLCSPILPTFSNFLLHQTFPVTQCLNHPTFPYNGLLLLVISSYISQIKLGKFICLKK